MNWGIRVLQTLALPLGYDAIIPKKQRSKSIVFREFGADDEARTRYLHLGKVALYRMSYIRTETASVIIRHNSCGCQAVFINFPIFRAGASLSLLLFPIKAFHAIIRK